jgi:plastocyanin
VRFGEYFYRPAVVSVRVGERVRFVNIGRIDRTVADVDARGRLRGTVIRPRLLSRGQAQIVAFRAAGVVRYVCTLHPTRMRGVVRVTR